jgi:hypothetical protein
MPTHEFEASIVDALTRRIAQPDSHLVIRLQRSGALGPDIVIQNAETGRELAIELKRSSGTLPISLYPQLKAISEECKGSGTDFIVLTTAPPSGILAHSSSTAHIDIVQVRDSEDAMQVLEPRLKLLDPRK